MRRLKTDSEVHSEDEDRIKREEAIKKQQQYLSKLKCPICGSSKFNKSILLADSVCDHSHGVSKIRSYVKTSDEHRYNELYEVNTTMCLECGYISSFANFETLLIERLRY